MDALNTSEWCFQSSSDLIGRNVYCLSACFCTSLCLNGLLSWQRELSEEEPCTPATVEWTTIIFLGETVWIRSNELCDCSNIAAVSGNSLRVHMTTHRPARVSAVTLAWCYSPFAAVNWTLHGVCMSVCLYVMMLATEVVWPLNWTFSVKVVCFIQSPSHYR